MRGLRQHWFLWALAGMVALAVVLPAPGARGGMLHPELTNKLGVALVFGLHGLGLSFASLRDGALHWRLHLVVQAATFVLFPLLGLVLYFGLERWVTPELRLGIFFLSAVPSTVSSSVALTGVAGGNVSGALFNATLSSLLGVVLTPLWMATMAASSGAPVPLGPVVIDLLQWLVAPLVAGQLLRPVLSGFVERHRSRIALVDRWVILFLVYTSFCDSFREGTWTSGDWADLGWVALIGAGLFAVAMAAVRQAARAWGFSRPDAIAAMFCGSKKSLAAGIPLAQLLFPAHPGLGMIVLPLMVYHSMQLVACSWLAGRWAEAASRRS